MSRVLLVAEATARSVGEFRRRWVRTLHRRYLGRYRQALGEAARRLAAAPEVTVLAGRETLDPEGLPASAARRFYEDELLRNDPEALAFLTRELMAEWWPPRDEPGLTFDGVWRPELMPVTKGILLRLDVVEYVGIVLQALDEVKPGGVGLLTGGSIVERVARALAVERGIPVRVARRSPAAATLAAAGRALRRREERRALAAHVNHRRALVSTPSAPILFSVSHARHFMVVDPLVRALTARRRRGVPSLLFYGGALLGRDRTNLFDVGDRVLVLGEHARQGLIEQGIEARRLVAVGDPRSNAARLVPPERLRADLCSDLRLEPGRPLIVMVSKYVSLLFSAGEKEAFYRTVHDAVSAVGGLEVVVKVHPNEDVALLRRQISEWGWPDARLTKEYDIHRLFGAADAAVMVTSMAGIEAMAMGCPVIAVQTPGKDFEGGGMPAYVSEGAVERVDMGDAKALETVLRRLVTDRSARAALVYRGRRFAAPYLHPVDGALADRLQGVVDEIRRELAAAGAQAPGDGSREGRS